MGDYFLLRLIVYKPRPANGEAISASVAISGTTSVLLLKLLLSLKGWSHWIPLRLWELGLSYLPSVRISALRFAGALRFTDSVKVFGFVVVISFVKNFIP